jgi:hypothetical protein
VADVRETDPISQANQDIRDFIRACGGRIRTPEQRARYEHLVRAYMTAVRLRDEARDTEPEPEPLAA